MPQVSNRVDSALSIILTWTWTWAWAWAWAWACSKNLVQSSGFPCIIKYTLKVIHIHLVLKKMFITLRMTNNLFLPVQFSYNYPSCSFLCMSIA